MNLDEYLNDLAEAAGHRMHREAAGDEEVAAICLGAAFVNACERDGWDVERAIELVRSTWIESHAAENRKPGS